MLSKNSKERIVNQISIARGWVLHMEEGESVQMHKNVILAEIERLNEMILEA